MTETEFVIKSEKLINRLMADQNYSGEDKFILVKLLVEYERKPNVTISSVPYEEPLKVYYTTSSQD